MPAAMVFPTAAAMPNHIPKTLRRLPRERAVAASVAAFECAGVPEFLPWPELAGGASDMLDNGSLGVLRGVHRDEKITAMAR